MRNHASPRPRALLCLVAVAILAAVVGVAGPGTGAPPASAADDVPYTLEVSSSTTLVDGQTITVTMRAKPGFTFAERGFVGICRDGEAYTEGADVTDQNRGKCPRETVSSSATYGPVLRSYPNGSVATVRMQIGTGTVVWGTSADDPDEFGLTCDLTHPCRLVLSITNKTGNVQIVDSSTLLTYSVDSPLSACAGNDPNAIATGGSDRLLGAWIALTRAQCQTHPGSAASTGAIFTGEGDGQRAFEKGLADLTYSAVGTRFADQTVPTTRDSVAVPLALNAAVIGVLGGYQNPSPDWPVSVPKPFAQLEATVPELATLFGNSPFLFEINHETDLKARNPLELTPSTPVTNSTKYNPIGPAGADASTWFATQAFDALAGDQWVTAPNSPKPNTPRGVYSSLAAADPEFDISVMEQYSSKGALKRIAANQFLPGSYGPIWILTDLATARELDMAVVAIPNSRGEFVAPTEASLLAAVPDLELQPDGTSVPSVGVGEDSPGAYPLTFVEHAIAPAQPLVDRACVARTGSQQLLADWLAYVTGPGQAELPDGLVALPPALAERAAAARARVGTTPATGPCAPAPPAEPGAPTAPSASGGTGGFPSDIDLPFGDTSSVPTGSPNASSAGGVRNSIGGGASLSTTGGSDDRAGGPAGSGPVDPDGVTIAEIAYPGPTAGSSGNGLTTGLAIVVLAVLVAVGGALSTGRRPGAGRGGPS